MNRFYKMHMTKVVIFNLAATVQINQIGVASTVLVDSNPPTWHSEVSVETSREYGSNHALFI